MSPTVQEWIAMNRCQRAITHLAKKGTVTHKKIDAWLREHEVVGSSPRDSGREMKWWRSTLAADEEAAVDWVVIAILAGTANLNRDSRARVIRRLKKYDVDWAKIGKATDEAAGKALQALQALQAEWAAKTTQRRGAELRAYIEVLAAEQSVRMEAIRAKRQAVQAEQQAAQAKREATDE